MNILDFHKQVQLVGIEMAQAIGEKFDMNALNIERGENADFSLMYFGTHIVAELPIVMNCDKVGYNLRNGIKLSLN